MEISIDSAKLIDKNTTHLTHHIKAVNVVRLTTDGNYCLAGSDDRTITLWNPHKIDPSDINHSKALLIMKYEGVHGHSVLDLTISNDKTKFSSCGEDKSFYVWDVTTATTIRRIQAHNSRINTIKYNNEATVVLTGSYDQTICCWDMRSSNREPIQTMKDATDSITTVSVTDNSIISGCVDGKIRIYDIRSGLLQTDNLNNPIVHTRVNEDQKLLVSTCIDGIVVLTDLFTGKILQEYSGHINRSFKTESLFENDNCHVIGGSEDGKVVHWNLINGEIVRETTKMHSKGISSIAYHPKDPFFVTSSYDGTIKSWKIEKPY